MRVQRMIYKLASGALGQFENPAPCGAASALASMLVSKQRSASWGPATFETVAEASLPIVLNAIGNNWGAGPWGTAYGKPLGSGYFYDMPYQPGNQASGAVIDKSQGGWIVVVGDPFAEQCTPPDAQSRAYSGCRLQLFVTPSESEALQFAEDHNALPAGASASATLPAFILQQGAPELTPPSQQGLDKLKQQAESAAAGIRIGSLMGAVLGIGIIWLCLRSTRK